MNQRFHRRPLPLPGLALVERQPIADQRGYLERMFCADTFAALGLAKPIVQINHTLTRTQGTVRGMHFQHPPHAETKVISCLRGEVFDVAVDLRRGSPTFLRWHGETLSGENHRTLIIPEGFAHGFQALTDDCELLYFHTARHTPHAEGGISPTDPRLAIVWPLPVTELSERDAGWTLLSAQFDGLAT